MNERGDPEVVPQSNRQVELQEAEEELARKTALIGKEKKVLADLALEKAKVELEVQNHMMQPEKTNRQLKRSSKAAGDS